jgi:Transposase IS116/IS110/IS902 family
MDLLVEVGDPTRFRPEAQFARWCGAAPVAVSSGEGDQAPAHHRLDLAGNRQVNSVLHLMHVTQVRGYPPARDTSTASAPSTRPSGKPAAPTNGTWPTSSSAACGPTTPDGTGPTHNPLQRRPLDKGASSR